MNLVQVTTCAVSKRIKWDDSSDRKWLMNHLHWAVKNGHSVLLTPVDDSPRFRVVPIAYDFAGWSAVPEGEHNAWGIERITDNMLVGKAVKSNRAGAERECRLLNEKGVVSNG